LTFFRAAALFFGQVLFGMVRARFLKNCVSGKACDFFSTFSATHHSGWFFVHVPKWMVKSTNMSSFLPFLQHPDMKKKVSRHSLSLLLFSKIASIFQKIDCKIFDEGDENFNLLLFVSSICV